MPFPSTKVVHPRWGETHGQVSDEAMNATVRVLKGTASTWTPEQGPVAGAANIIYAGRARVSYDLDRPFTKDNADQITSTAIVLVALPRDAVYSTMPEAGMTVLVDDVDENGLRHLPDTTLRILKARHSGLSFGPVLDCSESVGRTNG